MITLPYTEIIDLKSNYNEVEYSLFVRLLMIIKLVTKLIQACFCSMRNICFQPVMEFKEFMKIILLLASDIKF